MNSARPTISAVATIDICICTFRRPQVENTLRSVMAQTVTNALILSIIVADNDDTPSAQKLVEACAQKSSIPIRYIHAPARNISIARNACLDAATANFIAFIDDDEIASPHWLSSFLAQWQNTKADVILGPVQSNYPEDAPKWIKKGDYHSIKPVWVKGQIITGYTSNVFFARTAPQLLNLRFAESLGRSGGEDTAFFSAAYKAGAYLDYAEDALITEAVDPKRLSFAWLYKRYYRSGQTHALLMLNEKNHSLFKRISNIILASIKAFICVIGALLAPFIIQDPRRWLLRGSLHFGVIAKLLGQAELIQYG